MNTRGIIIGRTTCILLTIIISFLASAARADEHEQQLITILQSDAPSHAKDDACQKLKLTATLSAIPALAALLDDPALSHSARYALESINAPEAAAGLRDALTKTTGFTKAGIIDSLGQRGDRQSVDLLKGLLRDPDEQVAAAAITALGRIGGAEAVGALRAARSTADESLTPLVLDAMLACADSIAAGGFQQDAIRIYREIHNADDAPEASRTAAYRGLLRAAGDDAIALIETALTGDDRASILATLQLVRDVETTPATDIAALLPKLKPEIQVALIEALSQRADPAAAPAIVSLARDDQQPPAVRAAALRALGVLGDAAVVTLLATIAAEGTAPLHDAARQSLVRLKGDQVRDAILSNIEQSETPIRIELISALGHRYETASAGALLNLTSDEDGAVRGAAFQSLAKVAGDSMIPPLVRMIARAPSDDRRAAAERALRAIVSRAADADRAARSVAVGLAVADPTAAASLLRVAAALDAPATLAALRDGLRSIDPAVADAAIRALAFSSNPAAAQDLCNIAKDASRTDDQRIFALRGAIRLADESSMPPEPRVALLESALTIASRPEERRLALSALARLPRVESLNAIEPLLKDPNVSHEAALASLQIATALSTTHPTEARSACEKVIAAASDEKVISAAKSLLSRLADQ